MIALKGFNQEVVCGEPDGSTPVGIASEEVGVAFGRCVFESEFLTVSVKYMWIIFVVFGNTSQTIPGGLPDEEFQGGTVNTDCPFEFLCDETYYLRIDIKGSPALRFLNHNAYYTLDAYTGCCDGPTPVATDPTLV